LNLLNNARVDLTREGAYLTSISPTTLTIGNLYGEGVFDIRFDLENELNDIIFISNSSSGNHSVNFYDKTAGAYTLTDNISLLVVDQSNPSGNYSATYAGKIDLGGYEYNLTKANANDNWYVYLNANATSNGSSNNSNGSGSSNGTGSGNGTSGGTGGTLPPCSSAHCAVKSFLSINYLVNYADSQTLLQRMGDIREGRHDKEDVWVRTYFGRLDSFDEDTRINEARYSGIQAGIDKAYESEYATSYLGLAFGYSKSEIDYLKGHGSGNNFYGSIYASVLFNTDLYMDFLAKYNYNKNKFDTVTSNGYDVTGKGDTEGFSFDVEIGKRFDISKLYIEPQFGVTYTNQNGAKVDSSDGMRISLNGYDSYRIRTSLLFGYKLRDIINVYLKAGYIKELESDASYVLNDNLLEYQLNSDIIDTSVGFTTNMNSHHLYLEGTYQIGNKFNNKKANIGYRYNF
ncbi:MAG: autotransporter outer membrane beta-barrel domain-containing protein, partial [Campylobacteraceae bacterium]|nr:autotransporter outer membrane beta-barrel domain-containing protein [Campylobacteraceae bacterium]